MGNLLNTLYVKMLTAREMQSQQLRERADQEDQNSQRAQQFALDVSRHIEDAKQKEFWRQGQLAGRMGKAQGELGVDRTGFVDPAQDQESEVSNLEGRAAAKHGEDAEALRRWLVDRQIGGRLDNTAAQHVNKTEEIDQSGGIRQGLQANAQDFTRTVLEPGKDRRAATMAAGMGARTAASRENAQKQFYAKQFIDQIKAGGPLKGMTDPAWQNTLLQAAQEANNDALDPNMTAAQMAQKWRARIPTAPAAGPGSPTTAQGGFDPDVGSGQFQ